MGIYGALQTAVSGLRAQSHAMENISGNIANSQTTGYKRIETSFVDLIPDAPVKSQIPGAVTSYSRSTNSDRGDIQNASTETYMALNGSGFFVVEATKGDASATYYTRRGDFDIDKNGYLVNGAGFRLKGLAMENGVVTGSVAEAIKIDNSFMPAKRASTIEYQLNLPQLPKNAAYDSTVPGSELLNEAAFVDPNSIEQNEVDTFIRSTIAGGGITVYSDTGQPVNVQLRWGKTNAAIGDETWSLYYATDIKDEVAGVPAWTRVGEYEFTSGGVLDTLTAAPGSASTDNTRITISNLSVNGVSVGQVAINHGPKGVTQFADNSGAAKTTGLSQNGYGAGEFISVGVNDAGQIVASYSNGEAKEVAQIMVANFSAPNELKRADGGTYTATASSGEPILTADGGVMGSSLEASNTDISEEFTKLIVTQQAYAANTRIVSAADSMLQETLNMIR